MARQAKLVARTYFSPYTRKMEYVTYYKPIYTSSKDGNNAQSSKQNL